MKDYFYGLVVPHEDDEIKVSVLLAVLLWLIGGRA